MRFLLVDPHRPVRRALGGRATSFHEYCTPLPLRARPCVDNPQTVP